MRSARLSDAGRPSLGGRGTASSGMGCLAGAPPPPPFSTRQRALHCHVLQCAPLARHQLQCRVPFAHSPPHPASGQLPLCSPVDVAVMGARCRQVYWHGRRGGRWGTIRSGPWSRGPPPLPAPPPPHPAPAPLRPPPPTGSWPPPPLQPGRQPLGTQPQPATSLSRRSRRGSSLAATRQRRGVLRAPWPAGRPSEAVPLLPRRRRRGRAARPPTRTAPSRRRSWCSRCARRRRHTTPSSRRPRLSCGNPPAAPPRRSLSVPPPRRESRRRHKPLRRSASDALAAMHSAVRRSGAACPPR